MYQSCSFAMPRRPRILTKVVNCTKGKWQLLFMLVNHSTLSYACVKNDSVWPPNYIVIMAMTLEARRFCCFFKICLICLFRPYATCKVEVLLIYSNCCSLLKKIIYLREYGMQYELRCTGKCIISVFVENFNFDLN